MASTGRLRIPRQYHAGIKSLVSLKEPEYSSLESVLDNASPQLYRGDLISYVSERIPLDRESVENLINFVLSLYRVRELTKSDIPEFVDDVSQSIQAEDKPELLPINNDWGTFKRHLDRLLRFEQSLGTTAKALDVMTQHDNVYVNAGTRILTDIRPVFSNSLEELPAAAVIVHTLKIVYHQGDEHKEFFVALDNNDISELRELLNRAEKKGQMLKTILKDTPMQYLDAEVH